MKLQNPIMGLFVAIFGATVGACGASGADSQGTPNGGGAGVVGVTTGGTSAGGGSGGSLAIDGGVSEDASGTLDPDAACAAEVFEAEPAPLNLMVMLDRSCSMTQPVGDPLWDKTRAGLEAFFQDASLDGVGVALSYFPTPDTNEVTYCAGDEATPTVPLAKLTSNPAPADPQEQALLDSLKDQTFNLGGTPMYQAMYGALAFATVYATAHPEEQIVVVLVTDGVPGESCDYLTNNNIPNITKLAKFGYENVPSIRSFAIGLSGSEEQALSTVAQAGGGEAFFLGGSLDVTTELVTKLHEIGESNLGCTFQLPEPGSGKTTDPSKVNVKHIGAAGETDLFKVNGKADCANGGWYYDDEAAPSKIELCPASCATVKKDPNGKLEVLLGCATIVPK